jgi:hypothetical protein
VARRFALCELSSGILKQYELECRGEIGFATRMGSRLLASVLVLAEILDATAVQHFVRRAQ